MATKSVRIDENLYERIRAHKRDEETFSETIERLIGGWTLLDLADTLDAEAAETHRDAIKAAEETSTKDVEKLLERQGLE